MLINPISMNLSESWGTPDEPPKGQKGACGAFARRRKAPAHTLPPGVSGPVAPGVFPGGIS